AVSDLVAARLPDPAAIAVDLARDLERVRPVALDEELHPLLARPALGVDAGIDDEAASAESDRLEIAEAPDREIVVEAELVGELFGIEAPAFRIGVEGEHRTDQRHLVRIFALPRMAGNRLVHREVGQRIFA